MESYPGLIFNVHYRVRVWTTHIMTGRVTVHRSPELLFGNGSALPPSLSRATMLWRS